MKAMNNAKSKMAVVLASVMITTGCTSTKGMSGLAQNALLGAATGAVTQINGNSDDVRSAATVGALLGILGGVVR